MDNKLTVFNNADFGEIRTLEENGTVLFGGTDVAKALGYSNPHDAISRHCKGVVKREGVSRTTNQHGVTTEQTVEMSFIPEGDVYRLIARSKLPTAERFESWVFDEVLPSIRKNGGYIAGQETLSPEELMAKALLVAQKTIEEKDKQLTHAAEQAKLDAPPVHFAKGVTVSKTSILIFDFAKILRQNGADMGGKRFFVWLRENGYLVKRKGSDYNMPTQRSMELGLFEIKETVITHSDGHTTISRTPKITGKGQVYFFNKILGTDMPEDMQG